MSTLILQIAGEFIETDEKIYFADNFDLYFYKVPVSEQTNKNITNAFQFISSSELETNVVNDREFMRYECKADMKTESYLIETTDIVVPTELIHEHITRLTNMYMHTASAGSRAIKTLISPTEEHDVEGIDDIIAIHDGPPQEFTVEGLEGIDLVKLMADLPKPPQELLNFKNQLKMVDVDEDDVENIVM
jgi:hypothetical protein